MRLRITHDTVYRYDGPVADLVQSLRLTPADNAAQRVVDWRIALVGGRFGARLVDGGGDRVESWTLRGPVREVVVAVRGLVDTADTAGVLRGHRELVHPQVYLRYTPATAADAAIRALADGTEAEGELALAHALSVRVAGAIAYQPGATHPATTAAEALAGGAGVCQDHAQVLIAAARHRGLPARYVQGYLAADASGAPHEAAHAWAELHVGGLGWVGFDPANRCCPDARYVRTGSGFDALDAAPIRGVAAGAAQGALRVDLRVEPVGDGETALLPMPEPPEIAAAGPVVLAPGPGTPQMQQ